MCSGLHKLYGPPISLNAAINSLPVCLSLICAGSRSIAKSIDNYVLTIIKMLMQVTNKVYNFQAQTLWQMSSLFRSTIFHCKFKDLVSCHKINCHQDGWVSLNCIAEKTASSVISTTLILKSGTVVQIENNIFCLKSF